MEERKSVEKNYRSKFILKDFIIRNKNGNKVLIGTGAFAKVYKAKCLIDNKYYAIKVLELQKYQNKRNYAKNLQIIQREIQNHKSLSHRNIVKLYNYQIMKKKIYLFMEYTSKGNLY